METLESKLFPTIGKGLHGAIVLFAYWFFISFISSVHLAWHYNCERDGVITKPFPEGICFGKSGNMFETVNGKLMSFPPNTHPDYIKYVKEHNGKPPKRQ